MGKRADEQFKGPKGYEVGYELFSINGKMLGHAEPVRVKRGERVLFHVLNASATEIRSLALPGHRFHVIALDGNAVPTPADVPVLWLGTAERVSAVVSMNRPGVWVMGDLADDDRGHGMGIVVEYAGSTGKPQWAKPQPFRWDYTQFGNASVHPATPDETIEIVILKQNGAVLGFNRWTLNGEAFSVAFIARRRGRVQPPQLAGPRSVDHRTRSATSAVNGTILLSRLARSSADR
jgi:FtsP/CotA-like multicopper oxidase with cupredoxin domain